MVEWSLVDKLDQRIQLFIGLGATDQQIRRLLDNWHIVAALAGGRLASCFEEFIPVQREETATDVDWDIWEEKLRHFPVTIDFSTPVRERVVRAGITVTFSSVEQFLDAAPCEEGVKTLRMKVMRAKRPVSVRELNRMLVAKYLKQTRLVHILEFVSQHPDSVPPSTLATGSFCTQQCGRSQVVSIPCIRKAIVEDGGRVERMILTAESFEGDIYESIIPQGHTILVIRHPLKRDKNGKLLQDK